MHLLVEEKYLDNWLSLSKHWLGRMSRREIASLPHTSQIQSNNFFNEQSASQLSSDWKDNLKLKYS